LRIPFVESLLVTGRDVLTGPAAELTGEQRQTLAGIFGSSVNLDVVRIAPTSIGIQGRPYTFGNTIRVPSGASFSRATLVHEMTHVWQFQTKGTRYISDSLLHQIVDGHRAYDVEIVAGRAFDDYTAEQQAMIVEQYYLDNPPGWATNPDVVRMLGEVRRAQRLTSDEIQQETWFGPTAPEAQDRTGSDAPRLNPSVPIFRLEF
jgi:hypothetical protein